jgi:hypothetical protein
MTRKLIVGDQVIGGAPEPEPTPPTCSARSPMDDWCSLPSGHSGYHRDSDGSIWYSGRFGQPIRCPYCTLDCHTLAELGAYRFRPPCVVHGRELTEP